MFSFSYDEIAPWSPRNMSPPTRPQFSSRLLIRSGMPVLCALTSLPLPNHSCTRPVHLEAIIVGEGCGHWPYIRPPLLRLPFPHDFPPLFLPSAYLGKA